MEGLQHDYFGLFPVGCNLVRGRHDFRGTRYDCYFKQLRGRTKWHTRQIKRHTAYWNLLHIGWLRSPIVGKKDPEDVGFLNKADKTIHFLFGQLDRAGVPFWAQNSALAIGENWREYERRNLNVLFENKGILEG